MPDLSAGGATRRTLLERCRCSGAATLRYENHLAAAVGDFVILHGRFSGHGQPAAWIVADIVRMDGDVLTEHWDVIQDEATREQSRSGLPMFGDKFPG